MISYIKGKVLKTETDSFILDVSGIGYKVHSKQDTVSSLKIGDEVEFWTHMAVRENSQDLYGFSLEEELSFFELLLGVSGIGPKTALNVLNLSSIETLSKAIVSEDATHLTKVSGIGKKAAGKIVLELRGKITSYTASDSKTLRDEEDVLEALSALGYSKKESREAIQNIPSDTEGTAEKVKQALKILTSS